MGTGTAATGRDGDGHNGVRGQKQPKARRPGTGTGGDAWEGAWRSRSQLCSLNFSQVNRVNYVLLITLLVIIEKKRLK